MSRNRLRVVVRAEIPEVDTGSAVTHGDLGNCFVFGNSFKMEYLVGNYIFSVATLHWGLVGEKV